MAEALKHFFDRARVAQIGAAIHAAWSPFDTRAFAADATRGLESLELKGRATHIAEALGRHLPTRFTDAATVLVASLGPRLETDEYDGSSGSSFFYLPHTLFVATHGADHFDASMRAMYELTQRFSCEFAIRPFIARYPDETFALLERWARDASAHVRRLVSEGTRLRLPWATRVPVLDGDPARVLALLEHLRDDPSPMVRRSVANSLNDLSKTHPSLAFTTCERWLEHAPPERRRLIEHALRSAIKRAEPRALALLGHGAAPQVTLEPARFTPRRVHIGETVQIAVSLKSTARTAQALNLDLEVAFVTSRGTGARVFKLRRVDLPPGATLTVEKRVSLAVHTTRKPRAGQHAVVLLVNGARFSLGAFDVLEPHAP